jgi:cobalt-zinc-cadmium efflux system outer membrane protein
MSLDIQLENFAGTGDVSGASALEATMQLSRVFELGDKVDLRRRVGAAELEQLDAAHRAKRADVFAEVARRFVHVLSDQEQLHATERATRLAEQARSAVQERVKEGAASPVSASRAGIAVARATIAREHAQHELASSRVALAVQWGDRQAGFGELRGDLFAFPPLEPLGSYIQRVEGNPELLRFASDARVLDAKSRLAQAQRRPNLTLSAGVRRLEALDDQALVAGFSMPLGSARRASGDVLALGAQREHLAFAEAARRLELHAAVFELYQELLHARTEAEALQGKIRPEALRIVQTIEQGYRAGRFSQIELAEAQTQLLEIEREAIRAAADFHSYLIEIERLTGVGVHTLADR